MHAARTTQGGVCDPTGKMGKNIQSSCMSHELWVARAPLRGRTTSRPQERRKKTNPATTFIDLVFWRGY